jgi:Flp pilus assembly protein TadG
MFVRRQHQRNTSRRGAATVELALTLPLLLTLTFGSIEIANGMFLKQALTVAAHETARVAISQGETQANALAAGQRILTARNVNGGTISLTPTVTSTTAAGTIITATVTAPASANSIGISMFLGSTTVSATVVMVRL